MKKYIIYQVDAFTDTKFKGNPASVVLNADGLTENQMQAIARELNNSETAFLFHPDDNTHHGKIRYFTPTQEVPICGHATIGAMYAKAIEEKLDPCTLNFKTQIGILPFEIDRSKAKVKIWMTQGNIKIDAPLSEVIKNNLLDYLGISSDDIDGRCPIQIASTGHSKVMIGITSREALNNLNPDLFRLKELSKIINCNGYFVFTLNSNSPDILSYGRMFAPAIGINEDPVTGNANGPLGAYLVANELIDSDLDAFSFKAIQGEAIGRDGVIEVQVSIKNQKPHLVKIAGEAVVVFKTHIEL
ncbi:MAG: PhzF family isomerase [Desulfamplus sp.]|nr:PhzF family isomerase [Desulfamplus sp.]